MQSWDLFPFWGNTFFENLVFNTFSNHLEALGQVDTKCLIVGMLTEPLPLAWGCSWGFEMTEHSSSSAGVITYALPTRSFCSCLQHHAFKLRTRRVEKTLNLQPFLLPPQLTAFASLWNDLATFLFTALNSGRAFCVHALFVFELTHCSVAEPVFHPALLSLQSPNLYFASSNDSLIIPWVDWKPVTEL